MSLRGVDRGRWGTIVVLATVSEAGIIMGTERKITLSSVVVCSGEHLTAEVGGEIVLMSVADGLYFGLNAVGSDIWRRLAQPARIADICAALVDEYEAEPAVIERDVLALVTKLSERQLVELRE